MGTVRFVLRTDKPAKNNFCAIQLIYQISGERKYFNTGIKLNPESWDKENQTAIFLDRPTIKKRLKENDLKTQPDLIPGQLEANEINSRLTALKQEIIDIEKLYWFNNKEEVSSPDLVIESLKEARKSGKSNKEKNKLVFDFIDKYIQDNKATRKRGSLQVYSALKNHLQRFEIERKKKVTFESIDYVFFLEFQNFLINTKTKTAPIGLLNTTIAKQLSTLKTFLNYAKLRGIKVSDQYKQFKIKKEKLEVIALTNEEFELLLSMDLSENKRLDQVRDVFCFSCASGLRYSDLKQLKREHIKKNLIKLVVTKTQEILDIPLNSSTKEILFKYETKHSPLPVISNQKFNLYIKELAELAGINDPIQIVRFRGEKRYETTYPKYELLTAHSARKTFTTLSLEKGMSTELVMKIGGWKTHASFARYVNITYKRTEEAMHKAWGSSLQTKRYTRRPLINLVNNFLSIYKLINMQTLLEENQSEVDQLELNKKIKIDLGEYAIISKDIMNSAYRMRVGITGWYRAYMTSEDFKKETPEFQKESFDTYNGLIEMFNYMEDKINDFDEVLEPDF